MPTVHFDSPSIRRKIATAREYGDRIKSISLDYNTQVDRIFKRYIQSLRIALTSGDNTDIIVNNLIGDLRAILNELIGRSMEIACQREGVDSELYTALLSAEVPECNIEHYDEALEKYKEILTLELLMARELGFDSELELFLVNPQGIMSSRRGGLLELQQGVSAVDKGVSYSFGVNMKKLGISAAAMVYATASMQLWKNNGDVSYYFGVRNSNYPCPLCDEYQYQLIPLSAGMIYPLHNRCVCSTVPVNQSEIL